MFKLVVLVGVLLIFGAGILRLLGKIFLSALGLTLSAATFIFKVLCVFFGLLAGVIFLILQKIIPVAAKYFSTAATWLIAAIVTAGLLIYAAGRNIFHGESITDFIKKLIPHENYSRRTDFSLFVIELADSVHSDIVSKLETQYEKILQFFKPLDEPKN